MDAVVTTALLLELASFEVWSAALESVQAGTCRIDVQLVADLYAACPSGLKPRFASTYAVAHLDPQDFGPIFEDAYARRMSSTERRDLVTQLGSFLQRNPGERPRYRSLILELMRSREQEPCMRALSIASLLDDLAPEDLEVLERKLSAHFVPHRQAALYALYRLMKRHRSIAPHVLDFCSSERVIERIRQMRREDPDPDIRRHYTRQALDAYRELPRMRRPPQRRKRIGANGTRR